VCDSYEYGKEIDIFCEKPDDKHDLCLALAVAVRSRNYAFLTEEELEICR
jgi:hypothetical protein